MSIYASLLPLRPTNVMHQLGADSDVPLLNGRTILDGLAASPHVIWIPYITHPAQIRAVLRAAAHLKAVVGLGLSPRLDDLVDSRISESPAVFFDAAREAAEEIDRVCPYFLHVEEPAPRETEGAEFNAVWEHLGRCLEAGFSSFGLDLGRCSLDNAAEISSRLLAQVFDYELCISIRSGARANGTPEAGYVDDLTSLIATLKTEGVQPDLVSLPLSGEPKEADWRLAESLAPLVVPCAIGWKCPATPRGIPVNRLNKASVRVLSSSDRDNERGQEDAERVEAMAYMEAMDVLDELQAGNSALQLAGSVPGSQ